MELKGSKTEKNLLAAFAGESQARNRYCGYIHEGTEAPQRCPACDHEQAYFELLTENY